MIYAPGTTVELTLDTSGSAWGGANGTANVAGVDKKAARKTQVLRLGRFNATMVVAEIMVTQVEESTRYLGRR